MFVYYYSDSFWWFVLAEVIISVGRACFSGAFDSWVIDSLKFHGCSDESEEKWWRSSKIMRRLCFLGAFAGSFFAGKFGLAFPWLIGGIISFLAGIIALFFSESYRKASDFILTSKTRNLCSLWKILKLNFKKETSLFFSVTKKSWLFFWNNPIGKFLSILVFVNLFSFQGPNMQWAPFFAEKISQNPFVWGFIWSGISLCVILGTLLSKFVGKLFNGDKKTSLLSIQLFIGFFLPGDSLFLPFPGSCIGFCPLAPHRQAFPVTEASVTTDIHKPFYIKGNFGSKPAFNLVIAFQQFSKIVNIFR